MGFDIKRAESIAHGYKEWIHKGQMTFDDAVKKIKEIYREDMAREIIRILEQEIKEVQAKVRWALVFSDVEEAEKARERLSSHNIFPDSQEENKLLWMEKDEADYAREHVGGLIEAWGTPAPRPTPERVAGPRVDARFEEARKAKVEEWQRKGYSEKLIEKALMWADSWSRGIAEIARVDPAVIYPKALDSADTWLEELVKALV